MVWFSQCKKYYLCTSIVFIVILWFVVLLVLISGEEDKNLSQKQYEIGDIPLLQASPFSRENTRSELIVVSEYGSVIPYMTSLGGINESIKAYSEYKVTSYSVKSGDTVEKLAKLFDISINTIKFQNGISKKNPLRVGMVLAILPIDGISYTFKKGDSLSDIARKYQGDINEIEMFNDVSRSSKFAIGTVIIIPGGTEYVPLEQKVVKRKEAFIAKLKQKTSTFLPYRKIGNYYTHPMAGRGILTQGYHGGFRAIDIGTPIGTPVIAATSGSTMVASSGTYGGGYGNYIVLLHPNGSKTLYAHLSRVYIGVGQAVKKGQVIGMSGNSGRSSGPHLHFEIRDGASIPCESFGYGSCN